MPPSAHSAEPTRHDAEAGFMLVAVVVMAALLLIALAIAAPVVARDLRRDKEVESQHRMEQYVRAIQLYQRKFPNQYPASIKVLEGTNNVRYLRKQYVDPLTGKSDWRLIHQGEQKTTIKGFFGQPLAGLAANLGSAAGLGAGIGAGIGAGASSTSTIGATTALAGGFSGASITSTAAGAAGGTGATGVSGATGSTGGFGSSGTGMFGDSSGGVIVGVGTAKTGTSVTQPNGQTTYETWEFWYDPRIEMLKQGVNLTGGGISSTAASGFGQNAVTGQPNSASGASGSTGSSGFGSSNGFGNSSGGFGNAGGFGSPSTPGTSSPSTNPSPNPFP
jgi:type II secretory pathway pseudopilin PulG